MPDPFASAYLSLGSNLGDRLGNLRQATRLLEAAGLPLRAASSIFETEPVDFADQGWFLNCVVEIATTIPPLALLQEAQQIESQLGRERTIPRGPRTLDVDILLYGDLILESPELTIPHPRMLLRRLVLEPLREIAPKLRLPGSDLTVEQACDALRDPAQVRRLTHAGCATMP